VTFAVEQVEGRIPIILNIAEGSTRLAMEQVALGKEWGVSERDGAATYALCT
jgi:4-hydroxy-tetrahydrodipicolinate synthase